MYFGSLIRILAHQFRGANQKVHTFITQLFFHYFFCLKMTKILNRCLEQQAVFVKIDSKMEKSDRLPLFSCAQWSRVCACVIFRRLFVSLSGKASRLLGFLLSPRNYQIHYRGCTLIVRYFRKKFRISTLVVRFPFQLRHQFSDINSL